MLKVRLLSPSSDGWTQLEIGGDITEASDLGVRFKELGLPGDARLRIDCRQISYINSVGIKQWISLFEEYRLAGTPLAFHGCSPAIVSQLSLIANIMRKDEIESVQLPFACPNCHRDQVIERTVAELAPPAEGGEPRIPQPVCEKCSSPLVFDESPAEYLHFLS